MDPNLSVFVEQFDEALERDILYQIGEREGLITFLSESIVIVVIAVVVVIAVILREFAISALWKTAKLQ